MRKYITILLITTALFTSCGKNDSTDITADPQPALLTFPAQNSVCTAGTVISTTKSTVTFTWNSGGNTNNYELNIKNLLTNAVTTLTSSTNQLSVNLDRDTPYSWYVLSKSNSLSTTAKSEVWKFYNAGIGSVSHPPFPADNLSCVFGQGAASGTVNLAWTANDPDNDILGYDVYFGTSSTPASYKAGITDKFLNGIAVTSGTTYYWKVITKDAAGNTSDSGIFQFKTN
ncbi:hypothetical protein G7074_20330 [Pedobacter sp. HDW13]|uniref:hypothetical protein n=1 Tax=Pedobacter sp. HDW13 TaxID=2714940 RepID=UPI00140AA3C4|nr:hypothetical protein [Pedobacter sp. HDW13]QIL41402.1 hypothetical protein G7074_20330 [Pedobacter sp. HDW13]